MKTADPALVDFLTSITSVNADQLNLCELFTVTLTSGEALRFTDYDGNLTVGGNLFAGTGGIVPSRGPTKHSVGFEVDETELRFVTDGGTAVLRGMTLQMLAAAGWMDKAEVLIQRLFWPTGGNPVQWNPVFKFGGTIAKPTSITRTAVVFEVHSHLQKLQRNTPQTLIMPSCRHILGDANCTVDMGVFKRSYSVQAGSDSRSLITGGAAEIDGYFDLGFVNFTSGPNQGIASAVRFYDAATLTIELWAPLPFTPVVGDAFDAFPGCNKTQAMCVGTYNNLVNFGGFPFVPSPETAI
jgi:uncharacterized phage protein (TIGR02218 family)